MSWEVPIMRSGTSFFDLRLFRRDLTRFSPIWGEYAVFLLVVQYFLWNGVGDISDRYSAFVSIFAWVNAVYGFIVAVGLFGYLADPRECGVVHTFPVRRECWFLTHILAGLVMALVPNGLFCLMNVSMAENGVLIPFAGMMLEFVFFFGLAVLSMMLTGRRFAGATVYALINWLPALVLWAVEVIYLPLIPGVALDSDAFLRLCPVVSMSFSFPWRFEIYHGNNLSQLGITALWAAVGVGLLGVALVLYRRRRLEYAGDFLALKWLNPVFLVSFSMACGCVLSLFGSVLFEASAVVMLAVGLLIGWFSGKMLMERTVRVFSLPSVAWAAALTLVVLGSVGLVRLDPLGRVLYVPRPEQVAKVELAPSGSHIDDYVSNLYPYHTEDPAIIEDLTGLHRDYLTLFENAGDYYNGFYIRYHLKSGAVVIRDYSHSYSSQIHGLEKRICYYYSQPECKLNVTSLEELKKTCYAANLSVWDGNNGYDVHVTGAELGELLEALYDDCTEGNMSVPNNYVQEYAEGFYLSLETQAHMYLGLDLPEPAEKTRAVCRNLMEKYTEWSPAEQQ